MKKNFELLLGNAIAGIDSHNSDIQNKILIREDFKKLIPELTTEELSQLEQNVLVEGIREPLIVWHTGEQYILIDGHNRYFLSQKHNLKISFKEMHFSDEDSVKEWMIKNQLGRRNLTIVQQSYLRGLRYLKEKTQGFRTDLTSAQNDQKLGASTAEILAEEYNVSPATIRRDGEFAKAVDRIAQENPHLKNEILSGKSPITKKEITQGIKSSKRTGNAKKNKLTDLAEICFEYITTEQRSLEQVCHHLGLEINSINPIDFFMTWSKFNKNTKSSQNAS